jgi:hypothetical protein
MNIRRGTLSKLALVAGTFTVATPALAQETTQTPPATAGPATAPLAPLPPPSQTIPESDIGYTSASKLDHYMRPVRRALEIQIAAGYGQGVGDVSSAQRLPTVQDLSGPGGTIQAMVGYRFSKHFALGVYGTGSQFEKGDTLADGTEVRSATAGLQADWHFRPSFTIDPWLTLGSGWRGFWAAPDNGKNTSLQGLQMVRLQGGVDFRLTPTVAVAPVVGGDASIFLGRDGPGTSGFENISSPKVNFFLFGGLQARFDTMTGRGPAEAASSSGSSSKF